MEKNQLELLQIKNIVGILKNLINGINVTLCTTDERINGLQNISKKFTQIEMYNISVTEERSCRDWRRTKF